MSTTEKERERERDRNTQDGLTNKDTQMDTQIERHTYKYILPLPFHSFYFHFNDAIFLSQPLIHVVSPAYIVILILLGELNELFLTIQLFHLSSDYFSLSYKLKVNYFFKRERERERILNNSYLFGNLLVVN